MDSLKTPCKAEPAELYILRTKEYSKVYHNKHSIVDKSSVYYWPENDVKQQYLGKYVNFMQSMSAHSSIPTLLNSLWEKN